MRDVERAERRAANSLGGTGNHLSSPSSFQFTNQLSLCFWSQGLYHVSEVCSPVPKGSPGVLSGALGTLKLEGGFRFQMRNVNSFVVQFDCLSQLREKILESGKRKMKKRKGFRSTDQSLGF